jgi:hypothetical protein
MAVVVVVRERHTTEPESPESPVSPVSPLSSTGV